MVTRNQDLNKRMNYFERQFLRAQDLADEQDYHLDRRRRHNQLLHTAGVADGLLVTQTRNADNTLNLTSVTVEPGRAIDADGREIVLLEPYPLTMPKGPSAVDIYIRYQEQEADPSAVQGIQGFTRIDDTPEIGIVSTGPLPDKALLLARVQLDPTKDPTKGVVQANGITDQHTAAGAGISSVGKPQIRPGAVSIAQLSATVVFDSQVPMPAATAAGSPGELEVSILATDQPAFLLISLHCNGPLPTGSLTASFDWRHRVSLVGTGNPPTFQHVYRLVIQNPNLFSIVVSCKAYRLSET